jgi:uncharacterized OsmC-like protein
MSRVTILRDDENRQLFVINDQIDLDRYDLTEEEKQKWIEKISKHRCSLHVVKEGNETEH